MKIYEIISDKLIPYGYWITTEGELITVGGHGQYHDRYCPNGDKYLALQNGWFRICILNHITGGGKISILVEIGSGISISSMAISSFNEMCRDLEKIKIIASITIEDALRKELKDFYSENGDCIKMAVSWLRQHGVRSG